MRLKQVQQKYRRKTKKVSVTASLKQTNHDCQWCGCYWFGWTKMATVVSMSYAFIAIFLISLCYNKI